QPEPGRFPARREHAGRRAQWRADRARARLAAAPVRAPPVLLEERQVAPRARVHARRPSRFLGAVRLPHARRPLARRALRLAVGRRVRAFSRSRFRAFICPGVSARGIHEAARLGSASATPRTRERANARTAKTYT